MSFMPEEKLGVAVIANSSGSGNALTQLVTFDAYDRLLGLRGEDLVPKIRQRVERARTRQAQTPTKGERQSRSSGKVSLPPEKYAGIFENAHWGTIQITFSNGMLSAKIGELPTRLRLLDNDRFQVGIDATTFRDGSFEVANAEVIALVVKWRDYGEARFLRKR
jgi:hypothetical protein